MGPEFFQTRMGRKYYESDLPRQIKAMEELTKAIEESNRLKREEIETKQENKEEK